MTSMKRDPLPAPKAETVCCEPPAYPWGLELTLDNECLEKLKLDPLPEAGEQLLLLAKVRVSRTSSTDTEGGGKNRSVSLQITDCALEDAGERKSAEDTLYQG